MRTEADVREFFENYLPREASPAGKFLLTRGRIAEDGLSINVKLVFSYQSKLVYLGHAASAIMLVHSFSEKHVGWSDYQAFLELFGVQAEAEVIQRLPGSQTVPLFAAWVPGDCKFLCA